MGNGEWGMDYDTSGIFWRGAVSAWGAVDCCDFLEFYQTFGRLYRTLWNFVERKVMMGR